LARCPLSADLPDDRQLFWHLRGGRFWPSISEQRGGGGHGDGTVDCALDRRRLRLRALPLPRSPAADRESPPHLHAAFDSAAGANVGDLPHAWQLEHLP